MKTFALTTLGSLTLLSACATAATHSGETHSHAHNHSGDCGHTAVAHMGHTDYLHDGHMHHEHADHQDEHLVMVSAANPAVHDPVSLGKHDGHIHTMADAAHSAIPHGDHVDFFHDGHLHHVHDDHIDEHGAL